MDQSPTLVNCQYLPYILSLLDHPRQVLRCMQVCKGLYNTIKANFHLMKKYKVDISFITNYNADATGSEEVVYQIGIGTVPEFYGNQRRLLQIAFHRLRTELINFVKNTFNTYNSASNGALQSFNEFLQRQLYKFDFANITIFEKKFNRHCPTTVAGTMLSSIYEYVQKAGVQSEQCTIGSPFHIELAHLLGCKLTTIHVNETEYAHLPLVAINSGEVKAICSLQSTAAIIDPIRRIIQELVHGRYGNCNLHLEYNVAMPTGDQISTLLNEFNVAYTNKQRGNIETRLKREIDGKQLEIRYSVRYQDHFTLTFKQSS